MGNTYSNNFKAIIEITRKDIDLTTIEQANNELLLSFVVASKYNQDYVKQT